jgi:hypothetical protein
MTNETTAPIHSESMRRTSDADVSGGGDFSLDAFFESMKLSLYGRPHPVELLVHPPLFEGAEQATYSTPVQDSVFVGFECLIHLAVTDIRLVWTDGNAGTPNEPDYFTWPEYEVEGYLCQANGSEGQYRVWVRCTLYSCDNGQSIKEVVVYRLAFGEELGTDWTAIVQRG